MSPSVRADGLECAYDGLRSGFDGRCIHNPHGDWRIPTTAAARSYSAVCRHLLVWIGMGEAATADTDRIPDLVGLDPEHYAINRGYLHADANYELLTDNIVDLGHIERACSEVKPSVTPRRRSARTATASSFAA